MVIDRLVRGRAWIPVLGIMLAGIVAMQVEVLKLNAGIGRSMQQTTQLNARNEVLRASVAQLSDDQRIESVAARMGMIMPAPSAVGFLSARASGVHQSLSNIHVPNPTQFLNITSTNGTVAGGPSSTSGASPTSGTTGTSSAGTGGTTSGATAPNAPAATAGVTSAASTGVTAASPIGSGTQGGTSSGQ